MVFAENIVLTNILIAFVLNSGFIPQPSMALLTSFVLQVSSSLLDSFFYEEKKKKDNAHFLFYPRIRYFVLKGFFCKDGSYKWTRELFFPFIECYFYYLHQIFFHKVILYSKKTVVEVKAKNSDRMFH